MIKLDRFLCYFVMIIVLCFYFYFTEKNSSLIKVNNNLCKQIEDNRKKKISGFFTDAIFDINLMHSHPNTLVDGLYARASVYFCTITDKKNPDILNSLDKNSSVCRLWTSHSKEKYVENFEKYNHEISENNKTIKIRYQCILDGLDIVNKICLAK